MKVIKWIFISLVALLLAAIVSTFFMSDNFRVYQTQVIKASPEAVFNQLNTVKSWENWSYWRGLDDKMVMTYNDIPSGVGASYAWRSEKKKVGSGSFTIDQARPNDYIHAKLDFGGQASATSEYILKAVPEGTELTSAMNMDTKTILEKLMARIMIKYAMLDAFEQSAQKMEVYLKANPSVPTKSDDSLFTKATAKDCTIVKK